jgi:hypothetical protein
VFEPEPVYSGALNTVGDLGNGYLANTSSLLAAHNKLATICIAAGRCEAPDESKSDE